MEPQAEAETDTRPLDVDLRQRVFDYPLKLDYSDENDAYEEHHQVFARIEDAMKTIVDDPMIIAGMPYLPINEELTSEHDRRARGWMEMDYATPFELNTEQMEAARIWLDSLGLQADDLDSPLDLSMVGQTLEMKGNLKMLVESDFDDDKSGISVRSLLEKMRFCTNLEIYTNNLVQKSRSAYATHLPGVLPDDIVVVSDISLGSSGMYLGRIDNKHFLGINPDISYENVYFDPNSIDPESDLSVLEHELAHVAHFDTIPPIEGFVNQFPGSLTASDNLGTYYNIVEYLTNDGEDGDGVSDPGLLAYIAEGYAVVTQLHLLNKRNQSSVHENDAASPKRDLLRMLRYRDSYDSMMNDEKRCRMAKYSEGSFMIKRLYKRYGFDTLPEIVAHIDSEACMRIKPGTTEFEEIQRDPSLIPGLEYLHEREVA